MHSIDFSVNVWELTTSMCREDERRDSGCVGSDRCLEGIVELGGYWYRRGIGFDSVVLEIAVYTRFFIYFA